MRKLSVASRLRVIRCVVILIPAAALLTIGVLINAHMDKEKRAERVADHARLVAASVDQRLRELLEIATFCATAPALTERIDLASVAENCGRYASRVGAWVVLIETGETHRQILNTRPDAPAILPSYPRMDEQTTLRALEEWSSATGMPGLTNVFRGIIYPGGVVSAGQSLRLADGRSAMVYVSIASRALSELLAGITVDGGPVFALVDPSRRVVARSVAIDRVMFSAAPDWLITRMRTGLAGSALGVSGPRAVGGIWDAGYNPLSAAHGWFAVAFHPTPVGVPFWASAALPSAFTLLGLLLSSLLFWAMADRDRVTRRVAEAERLNREKSRLLASFAHDIRSPLISLIGSLEMTNEDNGARNHQVLSARSSAETLLQLVDDILELSFLGSGELILHPSPVDLRQLASALFDQTRRLAERKGLNLRLDVDSRLPIAVEVDRLRLQQILSNLLTNGVKYTEKGSVTLRISQVSRQSEEITVEFAVIDTGIGFSLAEKPRILREFGRLEREAERREKGTGLGLAIVQRILPAMGAALALDSVPGQGSTFSFRLTLPVATGGEAADLARSLSGVVILYAEDEPVIRQVTARRLEEAGAKVICAVDGDDALRKLDAVTPDLLLTDLQMPGLDGTGLIRRLAEISPERAYPTFVLTSHISGPQAAEARAAGADAVFTKPAQVAALAAAFRARRGDGGRSTPVVGENADVTEVQLLDRHTFSEATEIMGPAEAAPLVAEFEATMSADLSALETAIGTADPKQAGQLAHRCLGVCLVMGAVALARLLREMELAASEGNIAALQDLARSVAACLEETTREMRSTLQYNTVGAASSGR